MHLKVLFALAVLGAALAAPASLWTFGGTAHAAVTVCGTCADIGDSAGPLTHIWIGQNFSCQVEHSGNSLFQMFPEDDQSGDCSTVLLVGQTTYGYSSFAGTDFGFVSQTAVTGNGSIGTPFTVTTVGDAGTTGVRVTETDSYVIGNEFYRTDVQVSNTNDTPVVVRIYRGADCFLGGSDAGYGYVDPIGKVVACTENANNSPLGLIEEWTPITPADHYYEARYSNVENAANSGTELPDTCICTTLIDNGAAISWNRTIDAGLSTTVSHFTTFSPLGVGAPTATPAASVTPSVTATEVAARETPTTQSRPKTHTPTRTITAAATGTPTPAPPTSTAAPATSTVQPTGGRAGAIVGPNTGSGSAGGGRSASLLLIAAGVLMATGVFAGAVGRKVRRA